jgi:hypothetical protein
MERIMKRGPMLKTAVTVLWVGLLAIPALAQTPSQVPPLAAATASEAGTWNGLPDRFQIDAGFFRITGNTVLRLTRGTGAASEVDFENDLGLQPNANTFWVDSTWRVGKRHQLKLAFTKLTRESQGRTLSRTFTWNDKVFSAGLSSQATAGTNMTSGYYRFALVQKERFEIGPAVGVGYLTLKAGIKASGAVTLPGSGTQVANLDESGSYGTITGDVGGYFNAWASKRAVVRGDLLYIKAFGGTVTDGRLSLDYYLTTHVGLGVQYKYNKFSYTTDAGKASLGGDLTYKGFQVFASFLF